MGRDVLALESDIVTKLIGDSSQINQSGKDVTHLISVTETDFHRFEVSFPEKPDPTNFYSGIRDKKTEMIPLYMGSTIIGHAKTLDEANGQLYRSARIFARDVAAGRPLNDPYYPEFRARTASNFNSR